MDDSFTGRLVYSDSEEEENPKNQENIDSSDTITPENHNSNNLRDSTQDITQDKTSDVFDQLKDSGEVNDTVQNDDEPQIMQNDSSDEDIGARKKFKKTNKIFSSDDEQSDNDRDKANEIHVRDKTVIENEDSSEDNDEKSVGEKVPKPRANIWDTDSSSSNKEDEDDDSVLKNRKKIDKVRNKERKKKIKENREKILSIESGSDDEAGSSDASNDSNESARKKLKSLCDEESSMSSSANEREHEHNEDGKSTLKVKPREKIKQRMSAKAAEEQIKEIQSESQRLARDLYINVPYHKPKQYSLKEFLSRRTLAKSQTQSLNIMKAAAAIKMSEEELILYDQKLKERAEEAIEFFQNENEEEPEMTDVFKDEEEKPAEEKDIAENNTEVQNVQMEDKMENLLHQLTESQKVSFKDTEGSVKEQSGPFNLEMDKEIDASELPALEDKDLNAGVNNSATKAMDKKPTETVITLPKKQIKLHTEKNELDFELDKLLSNTISKVPDLNRPRLIGSEGMIIDLETNEMKPKEKSGADELLERFMKTTRKKIESELEEIDIFNTETGALEKQKIHHVPTERQTKDPKPGEAYFKLKSELGKKISEKRRETITKRIEDEQQKCREMESDDDDEEMEEYSDCGAENVENEETVEEDTDADLNADEDDVDAAPRNEFLCDEADEDEENDEIDEEDEENFDNNGDSNTAVDSGDTTEAQTKKQTKRSRIIAAFEDDSDEEKPNNVVSETKKITILSDIVLSQPLFTIPAPVATQTSGLDNSFVKNNGDVDDIATQKTFGNDDLQEFETRLFQVSTPTESQTLNPEKSKNISTSNLFSQSDGDTELGESQLMALCSGEFVTQNPTSMACPNSSEMSQMVTVDEKKDEPIETQTDDCCGQNTKAQTLSESNNYIAGRMTLSTLLSSDDEESVVGVEKRVKKMKKKKERQKLTFSDDEDDETEFKNIENVEDDGEQVDEEEVLDEELEDEEDPAEQYVDYDSEENEIEVKMNKKEVRKKASAYLENEAELSESEWGSADEDEKGLDVLEHELGDEDEFDKDKIQSELERIRLRQQIDQDAREVRIIKEMLFEEEEDGQERERKFRWKHLENSSNLNDTNSGADNALEFTQHESDEENEEEWRRLRYEREQLLKKQMSENESNSIEITSETIEQSAITPKSITNTSIFRRSSLMKTTSPAISSPFLINRSIVSQQQHIVRKSFLNRDNKTLEKLANLTKSSGDNGTITTTASNKGNYVFTATEKKNVLKRHSDNQKDDNGNDQSISKKQKISGMQTDDKLKTSKQTKCIFELLK